MKTIIKTALTLFLIAGISALLCGWVNSFTSPRILENQKKANIKALEGVADGCDIGETKTIENSNIKEVTPLYSNGEISGYALLLTGKGYGGSFTIMASYNADGTLNKAKMTEDKETAGLGKKAEKDWYMDLFKGMGDKEDFPLVPTDLKQSETELVSGATMTFKGVSAALREGSEYVKGIKN